MYTLGLIRRVAIARSGVKTRHRHIQQVKALSPIWADCHSRSSGWPSRPSPLMHGASKDRADIADIDATG
jgi:hypothetical protein